MVEFQVKILLKQFYFLKKEINKFQVPTEKKKILRKNNNIMKGNSDINGNDLY